MKPTLNYLTLLFFSIFIFSCNSSRNLKGFQYQSSDDAVSIGQNEVSPLFNAGTAKATTSLPVEKAIAEKSNSFTNEARTELKSSRLYLENGKLKLLSKTATEVPANATRISSMEELRQRVKNGEVKNVSEKKFKKAERFSEKLTKKKGLNDSGDPLIWAAIFLGAALVLTIVNIEIAALVALVIGLFFLVKWIINQSQ